MRKTRPTEDRFWEKVERRSFFECWPWKGSLNGNGYGQIFCLERKRPVPASRFLVEMLCGRLAPKEFVLHTCDNKPCVNPAHLYIGTSRDNVRDMFDRGLNHTTAGLHVHVGSNHPAAKLTEDDVRFIRSSSLLNKDLAEMFGVSRSNISQVRRGLRWQHV